MAAMHVGPRKYSVHFSCVVEVCDGLEQIVCYSP